VQAPIGEHFPNVVEVEEAMSTLAGHDPAPQELQKKYHVIAKLGEGGMALVHLAVVRGVAGVRKLVVLKSIRPELVSDPQVREMFLAEARLAATLNHPNIVQTYEVVVFAGRPVLVMEYMDGQPLSRILHGERRAQAALPFQLFVLKEVLTGLEYLQNLSDLDGTPLNLVHRDVSPHNIFVTYDGHAKLLDFGIAKKIGSSGNTETGMIKGKVRYMSPEQLVGSVRLDRRADLFAVGVMLWEAITGRRMWEGLTDLQVMQNLVDGKVAAPSSVAENVPPSLEGICLKAMSGDLDARYESAASMQADLEKAIEELGLEMGSRQVGKRVAESFGELRAATKKVIEDQLKDDNASPVSLVVTDENGVLAAEDAAISADLWGLPSTISVSALQANQARRRRLRRRWLVGVGVSAAAAAVALGSLRYAHRDGEAQARTAVATPAAPPAPAPTPQVVEAKSVHLLIQATPPTATLYLDDTPLPKNPFEGDVPSDSLRHTIRADAPGYRSQTRMAGLSEPLQLDIGLEALSPAPATQSPAAGRHVVSAKSTVAVAAPPSPSAVPIQKPPAPACANPFYFDESGIKHVKPECLK